MPTQTLIPRQTIPAGQQALVGSLTLTRARAHEFCGPARRTLAVMLAGSTQKATGPVFWISPAWAPVQLNPEGLQPFANPGRFTFAQVRRPEDMLWCMEEILRAGVAPLVVADLSAPLALTPVRRLHLAAETGARTGRHAPLGVLLTPGAGGAQGVESRWHMAPDHSQDRHAWRLERRRARVAPPKCWQVTRQDGHWTLGGCPAPRPCPTPDPSRTLTGQASR